MAMPQRNPPKDHDITRHFEPVDRRNIGGTGCFNAGVYVVRSKRTGNLCVEKKYGPESIVDGSGSRI